jgi:hypothetical protein
VIVLLRNAFAVEEAAGKGSADAKECCHEVCRLAQKNLTKIAPINI